jgi:S-DNA-T family DNA segregation ATPase FtsK/SpoIIIE
MRGLFPTRIALRLDQESYVDMTLGEGMRDKGAFADQIPEFLPGVAYVKHDGKREPLRVRAGYTGDSDIAELVAFCTDTAATEATVTPLHRPEPDPSTETSADDAAAVVGETANDAFDEAEDVEVIEYFDGDDEEPDQDIA